MKMERDVFMVKKSTTAIVILGLLFVGTLFAWIGTVIYYGELRNRFTKLESDYRYLNSSYVKLKADYEELKGSYYELKAKSEELKSEYGEDRVVLDVPFVRQKEWYCSEASASMVLKYYGYDLSQDQIHDMGYDRFETMLPLLSRYVNCKYSSLTIEGLKEEIDEEDPVILRIQLTRTLHTIVAVGYDSNHIYVHDPAKGQNLLLKPEDLLKTWWFTNYMAIIFFPKILE